MCSILILQSIFIIIYNNSSDSSICDVVLDRSAISAIPGKAGMHDWNDRTSIYGICYLAISVFIICFGFDKI